MKNKIMFALAAFLMTASVASAASITTELQVGSRGTDVTTLQTFLSQDASIYPQAMVTGYFGALTKAAVMNFQLRNELPTVGRVGPMTIPVINQQLATGMYMGMGTYAVGTTYAGTNVMAPAISGLNVSNTTRNSATVSWNTNVAAKGAVYYSSNPLNLSEQVNSVGVVGSLVAMTDLNTHTGQNVTITGLTPNTVYHYMIYATDEQGNVSVSWPATFQTGN